MIVVNLKFISYDGEYPCLCEGTLTFSLNGQIFEWVSVLYTKDGSYWDKSLAETVYTGEGVWSVDFPDNSIPEEYQQTVTDMVNKHVKRGCCGGCGQKL